MWFGSAAACAARARELDVPITTHLAQSQAEVATIGRRYGGRTPAEYLDWLGLLAPDLLAAHCIASTDGDLKLMAARGAAVLNCPRVFARSGVTAAFSRFAEHASRRWSQPTLPTWIFSANSTPRRDLEDCLRFARMWQTHRT